MDQLCIDQFNSQEVNQETPKMKQYYGNAEVTLVSINSQVSYDFFKNMLLDEENESFDKSLKEYNEMIKNDKTLKEFSEMIDGGRSLESLKEYNEMIKNDKSLKEYNE